MKKGNYFNIDYNGSFISDDPKHCCCENLINELKHSLANKTVLDLGCGDGKYLQNLKNSGCVVQGYDGNPYTEKISEGVGKCADLSKIQNFDVYDWVISFETGEHIPIEFENNFIENLTKHAKTGIIMSWAIEGQPGEGHVNCRNNDYIINEMYSRKFICDFLKSNYLREKTKLWWFQTNLLVFYKIENLI